MPIGLCQAFEGVPCNAYMVHACCCFPQVRSFAQHAEQFGCGVLVAGDKPVGVAHRSFLLLASQPAMLLYVLANGVLWCFWFNTYLHSPVSLNIHGGSWLLVRASGCIACVLLYSRGTGCSAKVLKLHACTHSGQLLPCHCPFKLHFCLSHGGVG